MACDLPCPLPSVPDLVWALPLRAPLSFCVCRGQWVGGPPNTTSSWGVLVYLLLDPHYGSWGCNHEWAIYEWEPHCPTSHHHRPHLPGIPRNSFLGSLPRKPRNSMPKLSVNMHPSQNTSRCILRPPGWQTVLPTELDFLILQPNKELDSIGKGSWSASPLS